jgi:hypothetical protein
VLKVGLFHQMKSSAYPNTWGHTLRPP